jgi:hypothetical protein
MVLETEAEDDYERDAEAQVSESDQDLYDEDADEEENEDFVSGELDEQEREDPTDQLHALAMELDAVGAPPARRPIRRAAPTTRDTTSVPITTTAPTGQSRWKTTARPAAEARGTAVVLRKEDRASLSKDQLVKLQRSITGELSHQFEMVSGQTDDQLAECYNLAVRVDALAWRLKKTDTFGGFDIFIKPIDVHAGIPATMPRTLPLIEYIDDLTLKLVRATMKFKRYYGQEYDLQDLQWTQELLENSCDEALRAKIIEKVQTIPDDEMGGAVYYYIMMQLIRIDTEKAVRSLLDKIGSLSIAKIPGENVCNVVSLIRGVLTRLRAVRMVPFDFTMTVIGIMETSTVTEFTSFFTQMKHTMWMEKMRGRAPTKRYVDKILETAETRYLEMLNSEGTWTGIGKPKSAFIANSVTCHHCGQEGHIRPRCPKWKADGSPAPGRGHAGGRGGAGRGRGGDSNWKNSEKGPRVSWRTTAPGPSDPQSKKVEGKQYHWCAKCVRWSPTHGTDAHEEKAANVADAQAKPILKSPTVSFAASVAGKLAGKLKD